jgi:site-specific DNA-methyltransferase (adenine-specific)
MACMDEALPKPYYEEEGIVIYHADCRDILPHLPKVDLVLTDPPYGINYNREDEPQSKHVFQHRGQLTTVRNDDVAFDPSFLLAVGNGHIFWGANCYASRLPDNPKWLAWDKVINNGLALRIAEVELAWTDCVGRSQAFRYLWSGGYRAGEIGQYLHPTQKPIELMRWCMTRPGVPDGLILDPFMGSGTTLRAAKDLGRKAIGIEIEEKYCEIAVKRLAQEVLPL